MLTPPDFPPRYGVPRIDGSEIARAIRDADAAYVERKVSPPPLHLVRQVEREDALLNARKHDNLRRFHIANPANDRGRLEPTVPWAELAVMLVVAFGIGALLAIGSAF